MVYLIQTNKNLSKEMEIFTQSYACDAHTWLIQNPNINQCKQVHDMFCLQLGLCEVYIN